MLSCSSRVAGAAGMEISDVASVTPSSDSAVLPHIAMLMQDIAYTGQDPLKRQVCMLYAYACMSVYCLTVLEFYSPLILPQFSAITGTALVYYRTCTYAVPM